MKNELSLGSNGESVKILQEKLKILGFFNALITGSFGESTKEGVMAFQMEYGLGVTGVVDDETKSELYNLTSPVVEPISIYPTLRYQDTGEYVRDLQTKLNALLYYTGPINSIFDLETLNAVKRFQVNNDLTADGIVGSNTWRVLNLLYGNLNECVTNNDSDDYITYTVQSGDTLYGIAKKYNTTVDKIKSLNNLTSNTINVGQVLRLPKSSNDYIKYTVQSGDTLYGIARKYNTTVDEIKRLNNLTSNIINVGEILNIPNSSTNYISYIVSRGDTLYGIAKKYNTTVDEIKRLNNLTSNTISIGEVLNIPI